MPVLTGGLIAALAVQNAVPPFATDMYTPAFPRVTADLSTTASMVGLTLTAFFVGLGLGQLLGGPVSDHRGRRVPLLVGGVLCTLGAVGCALAPHIGVLVAFRLLQGFGGGVAAVVGRAVLVDLATGAALARALSILMALGGLAPMIAPVLGAGVLTAGGTWRTVLWCLVGFGLVMVLSSAVAIPETLPPGRRHAGGLRTFRRGVFGLVRNRLFLGYLLVGGLSGFSLLAYVASSTYVLQEMKGMAPLTFAAFFASTALAQVLLSVLNARLVGRVPVRRMIGIGLALSSLAVTTLVLAVGVFDLQIVLVCAGFLLLMAVQAFIYGNSSALAASQAPAQAGVASALIGVVQAVSWGTAAPLSTIGGGHTAVPMLLVMVFGVVGSAAAFLLLTHARPSDQAEQPSPAAPLDATDPRTT